MKDLLEPIIKASGESAQALTALNSKSPRIGSAINALRAAQDNLNWELEALDKQAKDETAAAAAQPAGSAPAAK